MDRILRSFFVKKQRNKEKGGFDKIPRIPINLDFTGAGERIRTAGFLITSEILYQLSYAGFQPQTLYTKGFSDFQSKNNIPQNGVKQAFFFGLCGKSAGKNNTVRIYAMGSVTQSSLVQA